MAGGVLALILIAVVVLISRNFGNTDQELTNEHISSQGGKDETEIVEDDESLPEKSDIDKTDTDKAENGKANAGKQENKGDSTWTENPGSATPENPDTSTPEEPGTSAPVELPFVPYS